MKEKLSGSNKFFKSSIFYALISFAIIVSGPTVFAMTGGFSSIFPSDKITSTPGGSVPISSSPTNNTPVEDVKDSPQQKQTSPDNPSTPKTSNSSSSSLPLIAYCPSESIPYSTSYVYDSTMYTDEQWPVVIGLSGLKQICPASQLQPAHETVLMKPTNAVIKVGTKARPVYSGPTPEDLEYQRRVNLAQCTASVINAGGGSSSAMDECHRLFGY